MEFLVSTHESVRIPSSLAADASHPAKRQRTELLEPFPKRLLKILPQTKVLERDDDYNLHYKPIRNYKEDDFLMCTDSFDSVLLTRVREKMPSRGVVFDKPELEFFRLYRELLIIGRILPTHRNIVRLRDMLVSRKKVYIVTERSDLPNLLHDFFFHATNKSAHAIFKQLCETVQVMHRHGVFNCHLVPQCILYTDFPPSVKIFNFARAKYRPDMATEVHNGFRHQEWIEPDELFYASDFGHPQHDIHMLGKILLAMIQGVWESGSRNVNRAKFDPEALNLVQMLGPPPLDRPLVQMTIDDILRHPWMVMEPKKP